MNLYQWLCVLGVPAIIAAAARYFYCQVRGVRLGVQALLRAQLVSEYNKWEERGWAPIYARQNFENCWTQYHNMGKNGVMDNLHTRFLALPTEKPEKGE